jgi:hypothetical protein
MNGEVGIRPQFLIWSKRIWSLTIYAGRSFSKLISGVRICGAQILKERGLSQRIWRVRFLKASTYGEPI